MRAVPVLRRTASPRERRGRPLSLLSHTEREDSAGPGDTYMYTVPHTIEGRSPMHVLRGVVCTICIVLPQSPLLRRRR